MSPPKLDKLDKPILLLDGGLGTTLEDIHAVRFSTETPLWSGHCLIAHPATLERCQSSFAAVGADIVLTATYQTSFAGFARTPRIHGDGVGYTEDEAEVFMKSAVPIARRALKEAGRDDAVVALSLGSFGATLTPSQEYTGAYPEDYASWVPLYHFHMERVRVFIEDMKIWDDIDILAFETVPLSREVRAVREVMFRLEKEGIQKRFWVSCVFPREDLRLPDGSSVEEIVFELLRDGLPHPYAIGINCTKLHLLRPLLAQFEAALPKLIKNCEEVPRLVLYPDGADDLVYNTTSQTWEVSSFQVHNDAKEKWNMWDETLYEIVQEVQDRGLWKGIFVGGCCKTTPEHIGKLRKRIDRGNGVLAR